MFEYNTYEVLVKSALSRVSNDIDKREGSMVFNGVAPSMAELAQLFIGLDFVFKATYLLTAPREYLMDRLSACFKAPVAHAGDAVILHQRLSYPAFHFAHGVVFRLAYKVPNGIDKREGSMVFNGVAPSMAELAQLYIGLDFVFKGRKIRSHNCGNRWGRRSAPRSK